MNEPELYLADGWVTFVLEIKIMFKGARDLGF